MMIIKMADCADHRYFCRLEFEDVDLDSGHLVDYRRRLHTLGFMVLDVTDVSKCA